MQETASETMHGVSPPPSRLAVTYEGGDPDFLEKVCAVVDLIEVTPDSIAEIRDGEAVIHRETIEDLKNICRSTPIIVHGVGLSIGSHEGYSQSYIRLLDSLMDSIDVAWHSEHLGYTTVDGVNLGTMLPMPMTDEALDRICERVAEIRQRYGIPFLLENVAHVLPTYSEGYSLAGFLNAVTRESGCRLLLDVYNLECDAHNHGLDLEAFFLELNADPISEIHLANGVMHRGLQLDVHSRLTRPGTLDLARKARALCRANSNAVTYELLSQAVPVLGHEAIVGELRRIRAQLF